MLFGNENEMYRLFSVALGSCRILFVRLTCKSKNHMHIGSSLSGQFLTR